MSVIRTLSWIETALILLYLMIGGGTPEAWAESEWSGFVAFEARAFPASPAQPSQEDGDLSLVLEPELLSEWDEGRQRLTMRPFVRLDSVDEERSHGDLRELYWQWLGEGWDLGVGLSKVFWGVTESVHLVDIVNQTDLVEDTDGEDKLGQPMIRCSLSRSWGLFEAMLLPGFRERTFPGEDGRLRFPLVVDSDRALYASAAEAGHVDLALRWSQVLGDVDLGVSYFRGTAREPFLLPAVGEPGLGEDGGLVLAPFYDQIDQLGLDLQATRGAWLFKLEAINRWHQDAASLGFVERYSAAAYGFEFTFFDVAEKGLDLGLLVEALWDERGRQATTPFADDVFVGTRLAFNDVSSTELLLGAVIDRHSSSTFLNLEASRRIGHRWEIEARGRAFVAIDPLDLLVAVERDDYLQLSLRRYI